jgi:hypothetical protein
MQKRLFYNSHFSIIFFGSEKVLAQDVHFSQFFSNPVYLNPAFAGANVCPRMYEFQRPMAFISGTFVSILPLTTNISINWPVVLAYW